MPTETSQGNVQFNSSEIERLIVGAGLSQQEKSMSPSRRKELAELALNCCTLFDAAKVTSREKCYVGKLCQLLLEFSL